MSEVRLIDANAAISVFADMGQDIDTHDVIDLLKEQPTVDAVPVVRCKDCEYRPHWDEKTSSAVFPISGHCPCECDDYFYSWVPNDDWFCADGERRSE